MPKKQNKKKQTGQYRNQKHILENIMYSKQVFVIWTLFGFISVFLLAALLKLEITVSFRTNIAKKVNMSKI